VSELVDARADREAAVAAAAAALRAGRLVALPTDTVYGVAADAFHQQATRAIFQAKRRDRTAPLPVLVRSPKQLMGLVTTVPEVAERLMAAYWPGPLTMVVRSEPNLAWDLGDNEGTVAVRMPFDEVTLAIIRAIGPLAATSANLSGNPAATTAHLARAQLGDAVAVYVDDGPRTDTTPSTIVDLTRATPAILRSGPLDDAEVLAVARGDLPAHEVTPYSPPVPETPVPEPPSTPPPAVAEPAPHEASRTVAPRHVARDHRAGR
jgi:L-threonylcarbamoyladenylate synthase